MNRTTRLAGILVATGLATTAIVAVGATASTAHTPEVSATCETVSVSLTNYSTSQGSEPNTVTVAIDGVTVATDAFGSSFSGDFALGDSSVAHSWSVDINSENDAYDRSFDGSSAACVPETPVDVAPSATAAVRTTDPTCTAPSTLVLGSASNATWSIPTITHGPGDYSVTATAGTGHLFDDDESTRVFSGTLAGMLDPSSEACQPVADPTVVPPQPSPTGVSARSVTDDCLTNMQTVVTTRTTTGWTLNPDGTDWILGTPVVTRSTTTHELEPGVCPAVSPTDGQPTTPVSAGPTDPYPTPMVGSVYGYEGQLLAHNGTDSALPISIGAALLLAGLALVIVRRRARTMTV